VASKAAMVPSAVQGVAVRGGPERVAKEVPMGKATVALGWEAVAVVRVEAAMAD
jgi:hypothetical protein